MWNTKETSAPQINYRNVIYHLGIRLSVLLQILITLGMALFALPISAQERKIIEIPEIFIPADSSKYLPPGSAKYCVFRADLSGTDATYRKKRTLAFIHDSYTRTNGWRGDYLISAIDYVDFSYFHLVSFTKCGALQDILAYTSNYFSHCGDTNCQSIRVEFMPESNSRLVGEITEPPIPILLFESIRGKDELAKCTIKIPARVPTNIAEFQLLRNQLNLLRAKYSMSILDLYLTSGSFYILLSRQCDQKKRLFDLMLELLERENVKWTDYLGRPDFAPDISEYRFAETGKR